MQAGPSSFEKLSGFPSGWMASPISMDVRECWLVLNGWPPGTPET